MAGGVDDADLEAGDIEYRAVLYKVGGFRARLAVVHQVSDAQVRVAEHRRVQPVDVDRQTGKLAERAGMVEVPVRQQHSCGCFFTERFTDAVGMSGGIDNDRFPAAVCGHDIAVRPDQAENEGNDRHGWYLIRFFDAAEVLFTGFVPTFVPTFIPSLFRHAGTSAGYNPIRKANNA